MESQLDLVIVTSEPFPTGMAATNRIKSYVTEISNYLEVEVWIARPTEIAGEKRNILPSGWIADTVKFWYANDKCFWPNNRSKLLRLWFLLTSIGSLFRRIANEKPKNVLVVTNSIWIISMVYVCCRWYQVNIFHEKSELPKYRFALDQVIRSNYYRKIDGMVVMTPSLETYFSELGQGNIFVLPTTFDSSDGVMEEKNERQAPITFSYFGGAEAIYRDGVFEFLEAVSLLEVDCADFQVQIAGPLLSGDRGSRSFIDTLSEKNISLTNVRFLGALHGVDLEDFKKAADYFFITPMGSYSSGGFPTKLVEYFMTGKPVLCTPIREFKEVIDLNAVLSSDEASVFSLTKELARILDESYDSHTVIGRRANEIAMRRYHASSYARALSSFLGASR